MRCTLPQLKIDLYLSLKESHSHFCPLRLSHTVQLNSSEGKNFKVIEVYGGHMIF